MGVGLGRVVSTSSSSLPRPPLRRRGRPLWAASPSLPCAPAQRRVQLLGETGGHLKGGKEGRARALVGPAPFSRDSEKLLGHRVHRAAPVLRILLSLDSYTRTP